MLEVKYTHSNQRVVGGSRAEELIGRAAERDVFERRMYSQLPANHVLDSTEVRVLMFTCPLKGFRRKLERLFTSA